MASDTRKAKLYVILGSHACRTRMLMLEHKAIPYRCVTIPTGTQRLMQLLRFPHRTVPALVIDGRRVQKNRAIARVSTSFNPSLRCSPTTRPFAGGSRRPSAGATRCSRWPPGGPPWPPRCTARRC